MMPLIKNKYIIVRNENELVAMDYSSGGYPTITECINNVKFWNSYKDADTYLNMFDKSPSYGFTKQNCKIIEVALFKVSLN